MKLNNSKKHKKQFNPIYHWYLLLLAFFVLTLIVILYSVYSFFYIKNEIVLIDLEAQNSAENSTSTEVLEKSRTNSKFLKDINNLNKTLEEFDKKEIEYNRLIKTATVTTVLATTTASTTVATSTN